MKKNILLVLLVLLGLLALFYQLDRDLSPRRHLWITLPDQAGNWQDLKTHIPLQASPENLNQAMDYLLNQGDRGKLRAIFPKELGYYGLHLQEGGVLEIKFKSGYSAISDPERSLCEVALVRTLTKFPQVKKVYIYEEGSPANMVGQAKAFALGPEEIYLSLEESGQQVISHRQRLYFYNSQKSKLVAERKEIQYLVYQSRGKAILAALSQKPEGQDLTSLLDPMLGVNDVKIRNQVAYVDFSQEFVKAYADLGPNRIFLIYSIVNTLTDLDGVEYVQFLINGENPDKYSETQSLKTLFRKNNVYVE